MEQRAELHKRVERDFTYHAPQGNQPYRYNWLREKAKELAHEIIAFTPVSREQSLALTLLEQASMMANAAIARNEHQAPEEAQAESFENWQKRHAAEDQSQRAGGAPMLVGIVWMIGLAVQGSD